MRFRSALEAPGFGAIAEFKRRSPSAGDLRANGDVRLSHAGTNRRARGRCRSSSTSDSPARGTTCARRVQRHACRCSPRGSSRPPDELNTAREAGADAVLLILRDLHDAAAQALLRTRLLGLDTLVEAHDANELARAAELGAPVIGINARDLATFDIDRRAQIELLAGAPRDRVLVAESAITARAHAAEAELAGATAVLIGSALMRADDPGARLTELMARPLVKICGLTRQEDVDAAVEAGADLVGFILAAESPRRTDAVLDAPDSVLRVAVFVGDVEETDADLVQLYGRENGHRSRDAQLLYHGREVGTVIDLPWAEPDPTHLERARAAPGRVMLAGGLGPENVAEAIAAVRPWAVDSARSTESAPGIKHRDSLRAWVRASRG